ncbi:Hypothetical_protein [Hexamita inflata]|uniref:Hypothetical_protein n=1 Tax=Hexamita inflata TaxID=28002 RepID=A0ABP1HE62_9EUKA
MKVCTLRKKKFFSTLQVKGFYQIENCCIIAHYFVNLVKYDYFANLGDLDISVNESGCSVLIDHRNGVEIELKHSIEQDSFDPPQEKDAVFYDFEARGIEAYQNLDFKYRRTSFPNQASLKHFDETSE